MKDIGPVQLLTIGFGAEAKFEGRVMEELSKLENQKTIRMLLASPFTSTWGGWRSRSWRLSPGTWTPPVPSLGVAPTRHPPVDRSRAEALNAGPHL